VFRRGHGFFFGGGLVGGNSRGGQGAGEIGSLEALGSLGVRLRVLVVGTLAVVGAQED